MSRAQGRGLGWDWGQRRLWLLFMQVWLERCAQSSPVAAGIRGLQDLCLGLRGQEEPLQ